MDRLLSDLTEISNFVNAQRRAGQDVDRLLVQQCAGVSLRIKHLATVLGPCDVAEGTSLTACVNSGPWTAQQKLHLAQSITTWVSGDDATTSNKKLQKCMTIENYYDWTVIERIDSTSQRYTPSRASRISLVCGHASRLGITCASEKTSGRLASMIMWGEQESLPEDECDDLLVNVKRTLKANSVASPYPLQYLVDYPVEPKDLPVAMYEYAFPDGGPEAANLNGLSVYFNALRLRQAKAAGSLEARVMAGVRRHSVVC
jgi:hypothetical protein